MFMEGFILIYPILSYPVFNDFLEKKTLWIQGQLE